MGSLLPSSEENVGQTQDLRLLFLSAGQSCQPKKAIAIFNEKIWGCMEEREGECRVSAPSLYRAWLYELGLFPSIRGEEVRKSLIVKAHHSPVILGSDVRQIWL